LLIPRQSDFAAKSARGSRFWSGSPLSLVKNPLVAVRDVQEVVQKVGTRQDLHAGKSWPLEAGFTAGTREGIEWRAKANPQTADRSTKALDDSLGKKGEDHVSDKPNELRSAYSFAARASSRIDIVFFESRRSQG
jgi:hypothetical protein